MQGIFSQTVLHTNMVCIREGYTTNSSSIDVGGSGSGSDYRNAVFMQFANLSQIPKDSEIISAVLSWTQTGKDYSAAMNFNFSACTSNVSTLNGNSQPSYVTTGNGIDTVALSNPSVNELKTFSIPSCIGELIRTGNGGLYMIKVWAAAGNNRKCYNSSATLAVTYKKPDLFVYDANGAKKEMTGAYLYDANGAKKNVAAISFYDADGTKRTVL